MGPGITYVVTNAGAQAPWLVAFLCPCGCGEACYSILRGTVQGYTGPSWSLERHQGTISLSPSVHRLVGCRSHFFLTQGRIQWA